MSASTATRSAKAISKLRRGGLDELWTRGSQAVSAYRDSLGFGATLPTDDEFLNEIDAEQFGRSPIIAESLYQKFYKNAAEHFFPSVAGDTPGNFRTIFGDDVCATHIERANNILNGYFDLLGYRNLDVGRYIDWHLEPVSGVRSPMKHWKMFDELDKSETGDKKVIWELNRHQHFFTLGVAYLLTRDERYAEAFAVHLDSWIDQNPYGIGVNWLSSLEVSFRAISWIWAFHLFKDSNALSMELFKKALKSLQLHGRHIETYLSTYFSPNTHLTGEALALYYLGTQLPFLRRAKTWRDTGESILTAEASKQLHDDGVYFEQSSWYQRYTADFYIHFLRLRTLAGSEPADCAVMSRISNAFDFLMHLQRPDGTTPKIGDDDGGRMLPQTARDCNDFRGTLSTGALLFKRGDLKYAAGMMPGEEAFWLFGASALSEYDKVEAVEPPLTRVFQSGGYVAMRDGWSETDNYVLFDCGELGALSGAHGHADALSIDAAVGGKTLLVDPGTYSYHESRSVRDHFRATSSHNTITLDGRSSSEPGGTFSWRSRADITLEESCTTERFDYAAASHSGFSRFCEGSVHRRSILFLRNDYIIIHDIVAADGDHEYTLNFQYDAGVEVRLDEAGTTVSGSEHRLFVFGDDGKCSRTAGSVSHAYGERSDASALAYVVNGRGTQEFLTFLLPTGGSGEGVSVDEVEVDAGRAFIIGFRGYHDVLIVGDQAATHMRTELFETDFKFSWARIVAGQTVPDEYVLIGGRRFALGKNEIIGGHDRQTYASIRRLGDELYVNTDGRRFTARPTL